MALLAVGANAQDSYTAITATGLATEFANATAADGKSVITIEKDNITMVAVAGTTPANNTDGQSGQQIQADGTVLAWNDVKWDQKNQGDINYYYVVGTGNPYTAMAAEEIVTDDTPTGLYRALYTYYVADGTNGMPVSGLYYKFTPKTDGTLKLKVWSNKGKRNTFIVEESSKQPISYTAEGYINGQNDADGKKKWLTNEEILALHANDASLSAYVIGQGNQPYWGTLTVTVENGKSYWLFQDSSQIGFQGFEFAPTATGISTVNADVVEADAPVYNLAGQRVSKDTKGLLIKNGKKFINK